MLGGGAKKTNWCSCLYRMQLQDSTGNKIVSHTPNYILYTIYILPKIWATFS